MKWKIIMILIAISMVAGCVSENPETSSENTAGDGIAIESVDFMRTGALVTMATGEEISAINIYKSGNLITSENVGEFVKEVFVDLDWDEDEQYRFEAVTNGGSVTTSDVFAPAKPVLMKLDTIELEDVEPGDISKTTNNVKGILGFSPDSRYLAIGTDNGYLRLVEISTSEEIFEKRISEGKIINIEFSPDSSCVFISEESIDGYIYCFGLDGSERWKFRTGDELGSDLKNMPYARKMVFDSDGNLYAAARRYGGKIDGKYNYTARIYSFDTEGNIRWKFPDTEIMDAGVTWIDATPDGKYVVFSTGSFGPVEKWKDGTVHVLNGDSGEELWSYKVEPLEPYFGYVSIWYGTTITPDGNYVTALASDGRGFLFDNREILRSGIAEPLWQMNISTPMMVSGVPIYASANYGYNVNDSVIFSIGSTFSRESGKQPPIEHPGGNTLHAFDYDGNLLWKWRVEGYAGELGIAAPYLAVPISQNLVTDSLDVHGVYVFDLSRSGGATSKLVNVYRTEGITIASDVSPDGRYIAAFEAPARLEDGSVIGDYVVHILS